MLYSIRYTLVNRLVLNLCHAANTDEDSEFRSRTGLEPPNFASGPILGNIGGPVRTLSDDLDDGFPECDEPVIVGIVSNGTNEVVNAEGKIDSGSYTSGGRDIEVKNV